MGGPRLRVAIAVEWVAPNTDAAPQISAAAMLADRDDAGLGGIYGWNGNAAFEALMVEKIKLG